MTVTVIELNEAVGFAIGDDGVGIPEDDRDQVFELGYSTTEDGTGFELAIIREIVQAHGWEVSVTDSEDGGVRFEFETQRYSCSLDISRRCHSRVDVRRMSHF